MKAWLLGLLRQPTLAVYLIPDRGQRVRWFAYADPHGHLEMVACSPEGADLWNMQQAMRHARRTLRGRLTWRISGPSPTELAEA